MSTIDWLLAPDADPAIRWQAMRDLAGAPEADVAAERARVAAEGWGARLLALQGEDGQWDHSTYWPEDADPAIERGQPWTATTYTLLLLRELGLDPASPQARHAIELVRDHSRWEEGGQPFFEGEVEPCINGMVVALGSSFGIDVEGVVALLLRQQFADGGWNCDAIRGSRVGSFDTTINVLEGLLAHEQASGGSEAATEARQRGEAYLLERSLLRRLSTGELIDPAWLAFSYPTRWHYDVLRGLDYFRLRGGAPDPRLAEAIELVRTKRKPDGSWLLDQTHPGRVHFHMEEEGQPSRWNTLRALRVLAWWERAGGA